MTVVGTLERLSRTCSSAVVRFRAVRTRCFSIIIYPVDKTNDIEGKHRDITFSVRIISAAVRQGKA